MAKNCNCAIKGAQLRGHHTELLSGKASFVANHLLRWLFLAYESHDYQYMGHGNRFLAQPIPQGQEDRDQTGGGIFGDGVTFFYLS